MIQKTLAEMMVHIPLCTFPRNANVLFIGDATKELQEEFAKHQDAVDMFVSFDACTSLNERTYDIILFKNQKPDAMLLAHIEKIIKSDGIFVFESSFYKENLEELKSDLKLVGKHFWIAMPYHFENKCFIFASKKYHPTADLVLQKSDLLDDLEYYSSEIALAAFTLPAYYQRVLTGYAKR